MFEDDYCLVYMSDLKWYDSYKDVILVNDFINSLNEDGGLIAIGEDGLFTEYGDPSAVGLYAYTTAYVEDWPDIPETAISTDTALAEIKVSHPELFI